ncbi:cell death abnormality protein 1 [Folsomia candida]|uniref:cell death abnormality protein 1 n=1 Tax=Folsomia candida TaxID=158441 RepID=UPI001604BEB0|nr:cell death abnormality protein 1 [Folsomia candida]
MLSQSRMKFALIVICLISVPVIFSDEVGVDYGQPCNETTPCKINHGLFCILTEPGGTEKKCDCEYPSGMVYSEIQGKCVLRIGERCPFGAEGLDACADGAFCTEIERCTCPKGETGDVTNGRCVKAKGFNATCHSNHECDLGQGLTCQNVTCTCPEHTVYDPHIRSCRIIEGQSCHPVHPLPNFGFDTNHWMPICDKGSGCDPGSKTCQPCSSDPTGECFCPEEMYMDYIGDGKCHPQKGLGQECNISRECLETRRLRCEEGKCSCEEGTVENLEPFEAHNPDGISYRSTLTVSREICVGKVGAACSITVIGFDRTSRSHPHPSNTYCHEDAECVANKCKCKPDTILLSDGLCGRNYDEECSLQKQCADHFVCGTIDDSGTLRCRCRNKDHEYYDDSATPQCRGMCRRLTYIGDSCHPNDTKACPKNADCVQNKTMNLWQCECKTGFISSLSRLECEIGHGFPCNYEKRKERCDKVAKLECLIVKQASQSGAKNKIDRTQVCSCPNTDHSYDAEKRKCIPGCEPSDADPNCDSAALKKYHGSDWCTVNNNATFS